MTATTLLPPNTDLSSLAGTAQLLVAGDKGLLAIDESIPTCNRRFARLGIPQDEPARRAYRELILTAPGLGESISGVILYDETARQLTSDGVPFLTVLAQAGIVAGIKVDLGAKPMAGHPGEKVTEGLDGLEPRLREYARMGARFAKWRAVFSIGEATPSRACIEANANALARYAALCQTTGLVPIVEPEVLMAGEHTLARCAQDTEEVLHEVFAQLRTQGVALDAMLLKPNMILPGAACPTQVSVDAVAAATLRCLRRAVPAAVAGIAFLSGGQSGDLASARLAAMNRPAQAPPPWPVAFSFGRAIQEPALTIWDGQDANAGRAQQALLRRTAANRDARRGAGPTTQATTVTGPPSTGGREAQPAPDRPVKARLVRAEGTVR
ncbi:fructose-bisphosphate aldolase [Humibacillus sp. DSM 29435]|uniref:class I fructose-bisphosphate aldolase n=1 Tax=Humibacillus sp. DSM 29435 TaxID=1869167 RepID=UPI00087309DA|nr:class I fructose-bisphosphate aldolase [Humibacillus sp. DSM 29435]OFE18371.1 fructose-bisphosphate aldolase [Humibacillus sp. DSM 29435]